MGPRRGFDYGLQACGGCMDLGDDEAEDEEGEGEDGEGGEGEGGEGAEGEDD